MEKLMSRVRNEVKKSVADRMIELINALQLIYDSLKQIRQGRMRYLIPLSGQLRSVISEKSGNADPLLFHVAKLLEQDLHMYCMPDVLDDSFPEDLREGMLLHVSGLPITSERQFAAQMELTFDQILDREFIMFENKNYTPRAVIKLYANKAGGAHYPPSLPRDFASLLSLNMNVQPVAEILVQIGDATLAMGLRLLKRLVDSDIHVLLVVPDQVPEHFSGVNYLLDYRYEGSAMRISLTLNNRLMPCFFVSGLQGFYARVDCDRLIQWNEPRHIHATIRIDDELSTVLELRVDGARVGHLRIPEPLFVLSDPLDYESCYNRAVDGEPQLFSFAWGTIIMYGRELDPVERAKILLHIDDKRHDPELPMVLYSPNSFGRALQGTNGLQNTGTVQQVKMKDLLQRC
jgi:hypothetical protein